ncbi:MAG: metallophosphoesterase [Candidatus Cloacimonetes bacterium]|nr:metallophosphoesterase [Candidatus Cloacimonadota bacterium]
MKIQIVSDLHLEFPANRAWLSENPLLPKADLLLIAGDLCTLKQFEQIQPFIDGFSRDFALVISTYGNHEFYGSNIESAYPFVNKEIAERHFRLNNAVYVHEDIRIIASLLWSHIPVHAKFKVEHGLNDYRFIYKDGPRGTETHILTEDSNGYHDLSLSFIQETLAQPFAGKTVLLTHHLPSFQCEPEQFRGSDLSTGFVSNLDDLILSHPEISLWAHGHAHDFDDRYIGKTRVVRNPLGYVDHGEQRDFRRDFVVEL